ncbi:hypothetical protein [Conyzicola nivalis]|uniref:hypothetical protein n=1 Tax=Conyzicola nivalis TaxID=1477021 RepID=UPI0033920B4A
MSALAVAAGTLAFATSAVAMPTPASAHTPEASATCSTLTVALQSYSVGNGGAFINSISVEIDSEVIEETDFGSSLHETYPLGDVTVAHEYVVEIDASGTQYDREFSGDSVPCKRAVAPDASAVVSVAPATCDANGSLQLGAVRNATWGTPSRVTGPGQYSVTATAAPDHLFADGTATQDFVGALDGAIDADDPLCAVAIPVKPTPTREVVDTTAVDCAAATQTRTTTTTTVDWRLDTAQNTWVATPAVVMTSSATVAVAPTVCPTAPVVVPPTPVVPQAVVVVPPTPVFTQPAVQPPSTPSDVNGRAVPVEALASTGSDAETVAPIGAAILLAGAALVVVQRIRSRRAAARE